MFGAAVALLTLYTIVVVIAWLMGSARPVANPREKRNTRLAALAALVLWVALIIWAMAT